MEGGFEPEKVRPLYPAPRKKPLLSTKTREVFSCIKGQNSPQYRKIPLKQGLERSIRLHQPLFFCFSAVKHAQYFSRFFTEQRSWQNSTRRDSNSKKTAGVAENFACKSGCIGGKARCSCAVRCVDLRTSSTPVLLSRIVLVWLSPPSLFEQRYVSHRFSPKKTKKPPTR